MVNKIEFGKSDDIIVISKNEGDILTFASELRDNLDGFELTSIEHSNVRFNIKTEKGTISYVVDSYKPILIRDRKLVNISGVDKLIETGIIKLI